MTLSIFPDVNVWVALAYSRHVHHPVALQWFKSVNDEDELIFCRHTQMGLLRLLTRPAVMGEEILSQREAWHIYDAFLASPVVRFMNEPRDIESSFRRFARSAVAGPQDWADSYLAAFAEHASLRLITFDKTLSARVPGSRLLRSDR